MDDWIRVSWDRRCPVCGRSKWCMIAADGSAAICPRTPSARRAGQAGWLHRLTEHRTTQPVQAQRPQRFTRCLAVPLADHLDHSDLACRYQAAAEEMDKLSPLADRLGVSVESLKRLGVGYSMQERCSTWPIGDGQRITGIVRRWADGRKMLRKGDRVALYLPTDLPLDLTGETLLITEGGSDTAAGLDLGWWTVGRFSCQTGARLLACLIRQRWPDQVVIVADADGSGRRGAESLAGVLIAYVVGLKVITPPAEDLRAWYREGATNEDLGRFIRAAPSRRLQVRCAS